MENRISSAAASFCREASLEKSMELIKSAGFHSMDFPFSAYSREENDPMLGENWRAWVVQVKKLSDGYALPVTQAHAVWNQGIPEDFHFEKPREVFFRTIEGCKVLGCRHLIFHPIRQSHRVGTGEQREKIHAWNVRWFRELVPAAEEFGVILNLENTFDSHHTQLPGDPLYPYVTGEDMLRLREDIGSDMVQICLDTGHAHISGQDIPQMIRDFGEHLTTLHLNDNYGLIGPLYEDLHLFPGYGKIQWKPIFDALREIDFRGVLNIEPIGELKRMPDEIRLIQLKAAAETLRTLSSL